MARRPCPRSTANKVLTWTAGIAFTIAVFWALIHSSQKAPNILVRSSFEAEDRALAEKMFSGKPGVYGVIRVAPELIEHAPKTGKVFIRAVRSALASGQTVAVKEIPASTSPMPYRLGPEDALVPDAFTHGVDVSAHWSQAGNATVERKGDLKGKCAQNPIKPGQQVALIILGARVDPTSQPTTAY